MAPKEPEEWTHLNLKVRKDIADYWRGRREASRTFAEATLPFVKEDGHSLSVLVAQLEALTKEDSAAHEADIRRHAEMRILQMQIEARGGVTSKESALETLIQSHVLKFHDWRARHDRARMAEARKRKAFLAHCEDLLASEPLLKQRFTTPEDLLAFLLKETGPL